MAIDWTELFEDGGKRVKLVNTIETQRAALDTQHAAEDLLLAESTGRQIPQHSEAIAKITASYITARKTQNTGASTAASDFSSAILRGTMLSYMASHGSAVVLGSTEKNALDTLYDNMVLDSETILENGISVGTRVYTDPGNQGDWGAGSWSATVTPDVTGDWHQLGRSANCVLRCTSAGYAVQGAEQFRLSMTMLDVSPVAAATSPTTFVAGDHTTGTETEDVSLDANQMQEAGSGTSVYTGMKITIKGPDYNDISESGDDGSGVSGYDVMRHDTSKGPFNRNNCTFSYAVGSRNGTVYLRFIWTGGVGYVATLWKDVGLTIPLSDPLAIPIGGGGSDPKDLLVAASAASLFDGLTTGDTIMRFVWNGPDMDSHAASQTVTLGVPTMIAEGDVISFVLTSDGAGVAQSYFVRWHGRCLPHAASGANTVSESLFT